MNDFSDIPSQFDCLVKGHPIVFISYSWDSEEHKAWVRKFSDDLRTKYAINTLLDQYNRGGYDFIQFMNKGLEVADRVIIVGTPRYKDKLDNNIGGAKFEDQLISASLFHKVDSNKFVPVLREGRFESSFSTLIETRNGYNMSDDSQYDIILKSLAAELWNEPINAAPALGPKPHFSLGSSSDSITDIELQEMSVEQFANEIKRLLSSPNSDITYTELIENEAKRANNSIQQNAHYDFIITPNDFAQYADIHFKAVEKLLAASIIVVRFGSFKQQLLFIDAMVKLCMKSFVNGEISRQDTTSIHLLAPSFLFHTLGISCIKFHCFSLLDSLFGTKVPAGNIFSQSYSYSLPHLVGICHWDVDTMNRYLNSSWLYPYSEWLLRILSPIFKGYTLDDDEFKCVYCTWEHMSSLLYQHYKCGIIRSENFPMGLFVLRRQDFLRMIDNYYTMFFNEAKDKHDQWEPLKQGLFRGDYSVFEQLYNQAEEYYIKYGRH